MLILRLVMIEHGKPAICGCMN